MRALGSRSQLILFVAAVLVPCAALIALSLRLAGQDRELEIKHQTDQRHQMVSHVRDTLLTALEAIRAGEITGDLEPGQSYRHPETVFVAWVEGGRLSMPWEPEHDRALQKCRELVAQGPFPAVLTKCGPQSTVCFERALQAAQNREQAAYARWLLAQALDAAGQSTKAIEIYRGLLAASPQIMDPDGIPLGLHAALSLLQRGGSDARIVPALESALFTRPWLPPLSSYIANEIAVRLQKAARAPEEISKIGKLRQRAEALVRLQQQTELLQNDFPRFQEIWHNATQPTWIAYGEDVWLLSLTENAVMGSPVIAVRGEDLFRRLAPPGAHFADLRELNGEVLGPGISGLKLVIDPDTVPQDPEGGLQRTMLHFAVALAVSVTMFAAWLLWRDLKREMGLSELRAQFVASVSHELKTPLTAIRMYAETLQLGRCSDPDTQSEYLGTIVNESERLSRLVDGVLLFAKSENDRKIWHFRTVQPLDAVRAAARALEYPLSEQGFRLHMSVDDPVPAIHADRDAVEQAVLNLLSNAIKFSGESRDIRLRLAAEASEVVVQVTDHGIGIAPEERDRIFDKFYRARTPETRAIPGAGLGLALVSQIMKAHGGSCAVESAPGRGSTFTLRFPVDRGRQEEHS